ncbi:MAG TPA: SDR family NAD(P)-dependent oxidoreductase [Acidimicrobiia bacterium]|nr:SDR family NAD(P)-dependent oxidoreductase [Acidimicrobiia bacterium]
MLSDRRILVTGASSGIGRGLALAYSGSGARVWAAARSAEGLEEVADQAEGLVVPVVADLTTGSGRRAVATAIDRDGGRIDVAVHAAGILGPVGVDLVDYPEDAWRSVFEINVTAVHLLHQEISRLLDSGDSPVVIGLASTVGREPRGGWGMYAVSKHALEGWLGTLAEEWAGGRVYSVNPGGTRTPMRAEARPEEDPETIPGPEDIAALFLRLAHPDAPEPTGSVLEARDWIGRDPWEGLAR